MQYAQRPQFLLVAGTQQGGLANGPTVENAALVELESDLTIPTFAHTPVSLPAGCGKSSCP
jgi:hypothetical protein